MTILSTFICFWVTFVVACAAKSYYREASFSILHTSDIHGWVSGHRQKFASGTLAEYAGFIERLREEKADEDVLIFDSGDFMAGTGFTSGDGHDFMRLMTHMPFDSVTLGNHDLESGFEFVDWVSKDNSIFPNSMVNSNIWLKSHESRRPIVPGGNRYRILDVSRSGVDLKVGVLGFMYESLNGLDDRITIQRMDEAFAEISGTLYREGVDVLVLLMHEGASSDESGTMYEDAARLLSRIRLSKGFATTPVIFLNAHEHRWRSYRYCRDASGRFDAKCMRIESQCYMYRASFLEAKFKVGPGVPGEREVTFMGRLPHRQGIRFHPDVFLEFLGRPKDDRDFLNTPLARSIRNHVEDIEHEFDLDRVIGYSDRNWSKNAWYADSDSGNVLILKNAIPSSLPPIKAQCQERIVVGNHALLRNNVLKGPVTINDTFTYLPFADNILTYPNCISGRIIKAAVVFGNSDDDNAALITPNSQNPKVLPDRLLTTIEDDVEYDLTIVEYVLTEKPNFIENGGGPRGIDDMAVPVGIDTHQAVRTYFEKQN